MWTKEKKITNAYSLGKMFVNNIDFDTNVNIIFKIFTHVPEI